MKKYILLILITTSLFCDDKTEGLDYLNTLRQSAGLHSLSYNQNLDASAQNHADYLQYHLTNDNLFCGHDEALDEQGFTGIDPTQRAYYTDYKSSFVTENLSSGQKDIYKSIDGLMSAIYHRFGFLDTKINEIGIGLNSNESLVYNYNMGNSLLNNLCNESSYDGPGYYYNGVCKDNDLKISVDSYNNSIDNFTKTSPDYILWPPSNSTDIPNVFFEESPDPLPNHSVSGYPISIEFNRINYQSKNILLNSFKLFDENNNEITNTLIMKEDNDPNNKHSNLQFTLFPLDRLNFNTIYNVQFNYIEDSLQKNISWKFLTKSIKYPYYIVDSNDQTINFIAGKKYAIYFPPQFSTDIFNSYSINYNTSIAPEIEIVDGNMIYITLDGSNGQYCNLNLANSGSNIKTLKLQISSTDSALIQLEKNLEKTLSLELKKGWNLVSANIDLQTLPQQIKLVWQYDQNWSVYANEQELSLAVQSSGYNILESIENTKGTWIYANEDLNLTINNSSDQYSYTFPLGWSLAGTNKDINVSEISCSQGNYYNSWRYINNEWKLNINSNQTFPYENFDLISSNEGFWVYCK